MSARPGLSGGYHASGIPTGISLLAAATVVYAMGWLRPPRFTQAKVTTT